MKQTTGSALLFAACIALVVSGCQTTGNSSPGLGLDMASLPSARTGLPTTTQNLQRVATGTPEPAQAAPISTLPVPSDTILPTEVFGTGVAAANSAGALQVSSDGDLVYDFPLWLPSGRNGMQPNLSLTYHGRGANGPLGVGWSIDGLSQITRCPRTYARNQINAAIAFDQTDLFCLDGQQLFALNGAYGADGTEYRTERDMFAKVISGGSDSAGPGWFKVYLKNGRVLTYGSPNPYAAATTTIEGLRVSRTVPDDTLPVAATDMSQPVRYAWALSRSEDRYGNGINYFYKLTQTTSPAGEPTYEFGPDHITYTDTSDHSWPAQKLVWFIFQPRPDVRTFYISGLRMTYATRLTNILVFGPNPLAPAVMREYKLEYRNDSISRRSLLASITDCDSTGACKLPLRFDWELGTFTYRDIPTGLRAPDSHRFRRLAAADMNGHGLDDILMLVLNTDDNHDVWDRSAWYSWSNVGYKSVMAPVAPRVIDPFEHIGHEQSDAILANPSVVSLLDTNFVDMDRDGRADVITSQVGGECPPGRQPPVGYVSQTRIFTSPNYVKRFDTGSCFPNGWTPTIHGTYIADIDGDGIPDLIGATLGPYGMEWAYALNPVPPPNVTNPAGSGVIASWAQKNIFAVDVDASGRTSIMLRSESPPVNEPTGTPGLWYVATKVDSSPPRNVALLAGESSYAIGDASCRADPDAQKYNVCLKDLFLDLKGDGLPNTISYSALYGGEPFVAVNTGNGFLDRVRIHLATAVNGPTAYFNAASWNSAAGLGALIADLNGDQRQDLVFTNVPENAGVAAVLAGDPDFQVPFYLRNQDGVSIPKPDWDYDGGPLAVFADVNGDGLPDLLEVVNGEVHVYLRMGAKPDVITTITEGTGEIRVVSWAPIADPDIYQSDGTCSYPTLCVKSGVWVVSAIAQDDGRRLTYKYKNARSDAQGRGWLGFEERDEKDSATGIEYATVYDNSTRYVFWHGTGRDATSTYVYPFIGLPQSQSLHVLLDTGRDFVQQQTLSYQVAVPGSGGAGTQDYSVYVVFPETVHEQEFEASVLQRDVQTKLQAYDAFGNPRVTVRVTGDGNSSVTTTDFDNQPGTWLIGRPKRINEVQTTPSGESAERTTEYTYDLNGGVTREIIEPQGDTFVNLVREFSRDKTGLLTSLTEISADEQRLTEIHYDSLENTWPAYVLDPLLHRTDYAYHPSLGVLAAFRDENGNYTQWQFDGFARPRAEKPPDGADISISYSPLWGMIVLGPSGVNISTTVKGGRETISRINRLGRELEQLHRGFDGRWIAVIERYDLAGHVSNVSNPFFVDVGPLESTFMSYDALGRLKTVTNPDGSTVQRDYAGLVTSVIDEVGNSTILVEDQLHRTTNISEEEGHAITTSFTYGPFGVLEAVTDPAGNVTKAIYDARGRRKSLADPDSGSAWTWWSAFGEQYIDIDGMGNYALFIRDPLGRPSKIFSNEGVETIQWDTAAHGVGRIDSATSTDGITSSFTYDDVSRLSSETTSVDSQNFSFGYAYDPTGRPATLTYPAGFAVTYDYTDYGVVKAAKESTSGMPYWQAKSCNAFDQITDEVLGDGTASSREFDERGRLRHLSTTSSQGNVIQDLVYGYFPNGNLADRVDGVSSDKIQESYLYDHLNRLTDWVVYSFVHSDGFVQRFAYDDIGNLRSRLTLVGNGGNLTYNYSGIGAGPHAVTSINGSAYTYDPSGRETAAPGRTTQYFSWGLPSRVSGTTFSEDYSYDFLHRRIGANSLFSTTYTLGGLFRYTNSRQFGTTITNYVRTPDRVVAAIVPKGMSSTTVRYLHDDRLGSIAAVTEGTAIDDLRTYDPLGTFRQPSDPSLSALPRSEPLGFTEREEDLKAGLVNMLGRLYDPAIGRFTTPDPLTSTITGEGFNRYSYALNNPLRWTDPTGLQSEENDNGTPEDAPNPPNMTITFTLCCYSYPITEHLGPEKPSTSDDDQSSWGPGRDASDNGSSLFSSLREQNRSTPGSGPVWTAFNAGVTETWNPSNTIPVRLGMFGLSTLAMVPAFAEHTIGSALALQTALREDPYWGPTLEPIFAFPAFVGEAELSQLGQAIEAIEGGFLSPANLATETARVVVNKTRGDAWRDELAAGFRGIGLDAETEVSYSTTLGRRSLDLRVSYQGDVLFCVECKTGKSPYTILQMYKDALIQQGEGFQIFLSRKP